MSARMSLQAWVILGQTLGELFDSLSGRTRFAHSVQYLKTFCSRLEAAGDVISDVFVEPVVLDECVKFHDPSLNSSRETPQFDPPIWGVRVDLGEPMGGLQMSIFPAPAYPKPTGRKSATTD